MSVTDHMRVLHPAPHVLAFYDGRIPEQRFAAGPNWVDDGALSLGIASYAIVDGGAALIYDTHVSTSHARFIRDHLQGLGVTDFTVVLSHWHLDHVAGTDVFADCTVIANARTAAHLSRRRAAIEGGTDHGLPAINPLVLPTHTFTGSTHLHIGGLHIDLIEANIHSDDATVIWLGHDRLLLAGDCVEDCVTYVGEPENFAWHLADLDRLAALNPARVLPNHGDPDRIAAGGYGADILPATGDYITKLMASRTDPARRAAPLSDWIAPQLAAGTLHWFAPYETVHANNLKHLPPRPDPP